MTAQPFKHDFKKGNVNDLNRAFGYTQALNDVFQLLNVLTNYGLKGSVIDIMPLLDKIIVTNNELIAFTIVVTEELEEQLRKEMSIPAENIKDELH